MILTSAVLHFTNVLEIIRLVLSSVNDVDNFVSMPGVY